MSVPENHTYFLAMNQGFMIRYFLQTDIFPTLQQSGHTIVILTPEPEAEEFRSYGAFENVVLEKYEEERYRNYLRGSWTEQWLKQLRLFVQNANGGDITTTTDVYRAYLKDNEEFHRTFKGRIAYIVFHVAVTLFRRSRLLRRLLLWSEHRFFTPRIHEALFQKYRPQALITASLGTFDYDQFLMREARRHGTKTVSVVLSWDNTTTRGMPGAVPDHVVAWTEAMRRELVDLNDIPDRKISVGGVAHFDHYYRAETFLDRTTFCKQLGLDPAKKILFYVTKSPNGYAYNADIAEMMLRALREGRIEHADGVQLLVRLHPIYLRRGPDGKLNFQYFLNQFDRLAEQYPELIINRPRMGSGSVNFLMPREEINLLASILKHSSVVINCFSTLNIEASIFDVPMVNVTFEGTSYDGPAKGRYNIDIDLRQTHNQRVVKTGGLAMVYNEDELIAAVNEGLQEPARRSAERDQIRRNECGPFPGRAGRNIAETILSIT